MRDEERCQMIVKPVIPGVQPYRCYNRAGSDRLCSVHRKAEAKRRERARRK